LDYIFIYLKNGILRDNGLSKDLRQHY
jgi:hypothetical protein